jgi:hypothetical protein
MASFWELTAPTRIGTTFTSCLPGHQKKVKSVGSVFYSKGIKDG